MRDDWIAARRLTSAFHSGAVDNFLSVVDEIDRRDRWKAVALALAGEVSALAHEALGASAQERFDRRLATVLDRERQPE